MGFYLRKAFSFAPLRLNLSRSGLGMSVGVRGARVGVGPRGSYVHVGRGGLYYRQQLRDPAQLTAAPGPSPAFGEIESAEAAGMVDSSSAELLAELNRVKQRTQLFPMALALFGFASVGAFSTGATTPGLGAILVVCVGLALYARHLDVTHGTAILQYELDSEAEKCWSLLAAAFQRVAECGAVWHVGSSDFSGDWKRQAGVTTLVKRSRIHPALSRPPRVVCNLKVPTLKAGRQVLYFFPERLLVYDAGGVGAVPYSELSAVASETRFVEGDSLPSDANVVDRTWQYVNRSGGPDRRFRYNPELPVALYGEVHFSSRSGLNELFQCSQAPAAKELASAIAAIGRPGTATKR